MGPDIQGQRRVGGQGKVQVSIRKVVIKQLNMSFSTGEEEDKIGEGEHGEEYWNIFLIFMMLYVFTSMQNVTTLYDYSEIM